jgi:hypothetical protein
MLWSGILEVDMTRDAVSEARIGATMNLDNDNSGLTEEAQGI